MARVPNFLIHSDILAIAGQPIIFSLHQRWRSIRQFLWTASAKILR